MSKKTKRYEDLKIEYDLKCSENKSLKRTNGLNDIAMEGYRDELKQAQKYILELEEQVKLKNEQDIIMDSVKLMVGDMVKLLGVPLDRKPLLIDERLNVPIAVHPFMCDCKMCEENR